MKKGRKESKKAFLTVVANPWVWGEWRLSDAEEDQSTGQSSTREKRKGKKEKSNQSIPCMKQRTLQKKEKRMRLSVMSRHMTTDFLCWSGVSFALLLLALLPLLVCLHHLSLDKVHRFHQWKWSKEQIEQPRQTRRATREKEKTWEEEEEEERREKKKVMMMRMII